MCTITLSNYNECVYCYKVLVQKEVMQSLLVKKEAKNLEAKYEG